MKTNEWLQALRSGDYKQTRRRLSDGAGGFCCLGVLCEIKGLPKKTVADADVAGDRAASGLHVTYIFDPNVTADQIGDCDDDLNCKSFAGTSAGIIPGAYLNTMLEDLPLSTLVDDPHLGGQDDLASVLMSMNDDGKSFSEIADYIESVMPQ